MATVEDFERMTAGIQPCRFCGTPFGETYSDRETADLAEVHLRLQAESAAMARVSRRILGMSYNCDACLEAEAERKRQALHRDEGRECRRFCYWYAYLPEDAKDKVFATSKFIYELRNPDAWAWAKAWTLKSDNAWISGGEGVGKSRLARCILNAMIEQGIRAAEVDGILLNRAGHQWRDDPVLNRWCDVPVLHIQDVDKAEWDNKGIERLWYVLDRRHNRKLRTLITSNDEPETMRTRWESVLADERARHEAGGNDTRRNVVATMLARMTPMKRWLMTGPSIRREEARMAQATAAPVETQVLL